MLRGAVATVVKGMEVRGMRHENHSLSPSTKHSLNCWFNTVVSGVSTTTQRTIGDVHYYFDRNSGQ
jgi:hypothetical protein